MKKLAYVVWQDACSHNDLDRPWGVEQHSVGFVMKKTKRWIRLAQSQTETGEATDFLDIPQNWIKTTLMLTDKKGKKLNK